MAGFLFSGIELMYGALQFSYKNAEEVGLAQGQLFLLVEVLSDTQKRLDALWATAYDIFRAEEKAA